VTDVRSRLPIATPNARPSRHRSSLGFFGIACSSNAVARERATALEEQAVPKKPSDDR